MNAVWFLIGAAAGIPIGFLFGHASRHERCPHGHTWDESCWQCDRKYRRP